MTRHWSSIGEAGAVNGMRFMVWTHSVLGRRVFDLFLIPAMVYYFLRRGDAAGRKRFPPGIRATIAGGSHPASVR